MITAIVHLTNDPNKSHSWFIVRVDRGDFIVEEDMSALNDTIHMHAYDDEYKKDNITPCYVDISRLEGAAFQDTSNWALVFEIVAVCPYAPWGDDQIEAEFAEAERALLRLDPSGESLDATRVYEVLRWMRDKAEQSKF